MARRAGHKWPVTAATLLYNPETEPLGSTERQELARRLRSEHESKFHDLSGALGKGRLENPLVGISTSSRPGSILMQRAVRGVFSVTF